MNLIKTNINDLFIIEPKIFNDNRGYFFEVWKKQVLSDNNINFDPVQQNESSSEYGVIRGLHYQLNPFAQAKLVRVVYGEVLDVAVDLRKDSPSFGKHFSVILSEANKKLFFIPKGFAHGYAVLSEKAIFSYLCDNYYSPEHERGIIIDDPILHIDWKIPTEKRIISNKDKNNLAFIDAQK